jgi:hypothetical protein
MKTNLTKLFDKIAISTLALVSQTAFADQLWVQRYDGPGQWNDTTGDEFVLEGGEWHFNLDTKDTAMTTGIWLLQATLSDGSQHTAWIQVKHLE